MTGDRDDKKQADRDLWRHIAELRKEVESWPKWKQEAAAAIRREPMHIRVGGHSK